MEQLCVHALLVQLYAKPLVSLGKDYQLQRQPASEAGTTKGSWQRGHWRALSPLAAPVAAPMQWVEPVLLA